MVENVSNDPNSILFYATSPFSLFLSVRVISWIAFGAGRRRSTKITRSDTNKTRRTFTICREFEEETKDTEVAQES